MYSRNKEYMNMKRLKIGLLVFIVIFFPVRAFAYLDPGTGSMLVQALLAAVAAVSVSIGMFRRRLQAFFSRFFGKKDK